MPNRILKESICTSATVDQLTAEEERLFYRLVVQCDDYGRFYAHPGIVRGHCFPRKPEIDLEQVIGWLASLARVGLIRIYEARDERYLEMVTWESHQQRRASHSKFPERNGELPPEENEGEPSDMENLADDISRLQLQSSASNGLQKSPYPVYENRESLRDAPAPAREAAASRKPPKPTRKPFTEQDSTDLVAKWAERYGSDQAVLDEIEVALNHESRFKNFDERLYVNTWLRRQLTFRPAGRATNGRPEPMRRIVDHTGCEPGCKESHDGR